MALARTVLGNDYDLRANALSVGAFVPADGALLVAVHFGLCAAASQNALAGDTVSGGSLTWTQRVAIQHNTSLGDDPWVTIWTAPVVTGASMSVAATQSAGSQRHGLVVVEYTGHNGFGTKGTAPYTAPTGDLSMTLDAVPAADSAIVAACILRNWVGTASAIGIAINGTELHRKPSVNGTEVDELYTVVQAIAGWTTATQVVWEDVDGNNSNANQGMAAAALEILAAAEPEPETEFLGFKPAQFFGMGLPLAGFAKLFGIAGTDAGPMFTSFRSIAGFGGWQKTYPRKAPEYQLYAPAVSPWYRRLLKRILGGKRP